MSPSRQIPVAFPSGKLTLEGVVAEPVGEAAPDGDAPGIVICHPEPHLGGTMESPVIDALVRGLTDQGLVTFRFNYRGVGASEGESGLGQGEINDSIAALRMVRDWPGVDRNRLAVVGYSFGAGVALRVALDKRARVRATVAISPTLALPPLGIEGIQGLGDHRAPVLFLIGEKDGLTEPERLRAWVEEIASPLVEYQSAPDADRAWQGRRLDMARRVGAFLVRALEP